MTDMTNWKITEAPTCPHCKTKMEQMDARHLDWDSPYLWVCFNNNCSLFKKGWDHMMESVGQVVSYRFMIHPQDGSCGVIPALSHEYMRKYGQPGDPYQEE